MGVPFPVNLGRSTSTMNIFEILCKNAAFRIDPGLDKNGRMWKMLEAYEEAKATGEAEDLENACSLEDVLSSDELLSFVQKDHPPLVRFLSEKENLEQLLRYVVESPNDQTELSQKSMKVLTHNVASIRENVFTNAADNLDDLHSNLLATVVQKFLNTHSWYMADYFANKEAFRQSPEMLLQSNGLLQTLVDTNYCYSGSALGQWMEDIELVHVLVDTFSGQRGEQAIICSADVLCSIIRSISPLLQQLESETLITQMLKLAFDSQNPCNQVAQDKAIAVCHALADKYSNDGSEKVPESLGPVMQHVGSFDNVLTGAFNSDVASFTNTSGTVVAFDMRRMRVVELIASLLHVGNSQINEAMMDKGIFQHLLDAFFVHKWNNILQTAVMDIYGHVFRSDDRAFCRSILEKTDLVPRVSTMLLQDLQNEERGEPVSPYRGFFRVLEDVFSTLAITDGVAPAFESSAEWKTLKQHLNKKYSIDEETDVSASESNVDVDSVPDIFAQKIVALALPEEQAKEVTEQIKRRVGQVSSTLTEDTFCVVTNSDVVAEGRSSVVQDAQRLGVILVRPEFVEEAIKQDKLPELNDYVVVAPEGKEDAMNDDGSLTASSEEIGSPFRATTEEVSSEASSEATLEESGAEKSDDTPAVESEEPMDLS